MGRLFFNELGIESVIPDSNSDSALEKGAALSPEEICLPFKLMVANLISAWEKGADTVVMPATMGPCRLGVYSDLLKAILDEQGCSFRWILLDSLEAIGPGELVDRLKVIVKDTDQKTGQIFKSLLLIYRILKQFEKIEARARIKAGVEAKKGTSRRITAKCRRALSEAGSFKEAFNLLNKAESALNNVQEQKRREPVKILLTGEIYSTIEPFANRNIEQLLMDMGVSFEKPVTLGWWIDNNIKNPFGMRMAEKRKNPYMPHCIGGYAKETVGEGIRCMEEGYDGLIQVLPAGCMPEIVAKSIFDDLAGQGKLSVLTVIFDEMAGEAGYITRVEAFVDMLQRKKERGKCII